MGFWILAGASCVLVALAVWNAVMRARQAAQSSAAYDLAVYRDQLHELDRDVARGIVAEAEAERARAEIGRRVLEADRAQRAEAAARQGPARGPVLAGLVAVIALSFGVYVWIGAPGARDLPLAQRIAEVEAARADRPTQAQAEAQANPIAPPETDPELEAMVTELRTVLARRPDDIEGWRLLAQNEAVLGNFRAARLAQERVIGLLGAEAAGQDYVHLSEMMVLAAGGYVSPEAELALTRALSALPGDGTARYYTGLMFAQQGRPDLAYPIWRNLLADSRPGDPWLGPIRLQIEEVAFLAGSPVSLAELPQPRDLPAPGGAGGPTREQIEAASEMAPEDQLAMIEGMVAGLAERLATEGGPAEDWARLIGAYVVLGRLDEGRRVFDEALLVFADDPAALEMFAEAGAVFLEERRE